ncbi:MAG: spore coat protein [Clostridia bacterium]|nr:spore coat protein [Clostridia bacterium]
MATKSSTKSTTKSASNKSCSKKGMQSTTLSGGNWTEFAQDQCNLSDQEIISDVLGCQKSLVKLYSSALCETSCTKLRDLIGEHISECAIDQYDAFLYMNERGMYPTDNAPVPKVNQAQKRFSKLEQKMK